jgi:hypothetical protein
VLARDTQNSGGSFASNRRRNKRLFKIPRKIPNVAQNIRGSFLPAVGHIGVIFVRYHQPLFFGLVTSYLRLYLGIPCFRSFSVAAELRHVWRCKQRALCLKEKSIGAAAYG